LLPVLGQPLIERVIRSAAQVGADEFIIVLGHRAQEIERFLSRLSAREGSSIRTVFNPCWEDTENGYSILQAKEYLSEPFLLLMSDHLISVELLLKLTENPPERGVRLAVDGNLENPVVDPDDVTRVLRRDGFIRNIGKHLHDYDGFDTGAFYCTADLFRALEESCQQGDSTLSGAVRILAKEGSAEAVDVSGCFWMDVDDPESHRRAEQALLDTLKAKPTDGPVSRFLNRPMSIRLTRLLLHFPITPNQISLASFVISLFASAFFLHPSRLALTFGGVLAQAASVIDGCDGEVARLKSLGSDYGGWLDAVLDRYADALLLFGLTWHHWIVNQQPAVLWIGFAAVIGSFMLSYTADKYDRRMKRRISEGKFNLRMGRDLRVFLVFLGAVLNQILIVLTAVALLMNVETVRRLIVCRENGQPEMRSPQNP
jgi:CDP-L-myo-inositol myo-inositolphosphotransferase